MFQCDFSLTQSATHDTSHAAFQAEPKKAFKNSFRKGSYVEFLTEAKPDTKSLPNFSTAHFPRLLEKLPQISLLLACDVEKEDKIIYGSLILLTAP